MYKVFLVEDESVVREGLRDTIPWEQYGFVFAGEAGDGEVALPMIRKIRPDVLITDIRMPFMDGLALSRIVHQEFPGMHIIIVSGFNDFEYARKAIEIGVDQYLTKPITRKAMQNALVEVTKRIESDHEQEAYLKQFQSEQQEYEQFRRQRFMEQVFAGKLSVEEIYSQSQKLGIDITGPSYSIILYELYEKDSRAVGTPVSQTRMVYRCQEELTRYFLRYSEYIFFWWGHNTYGVIVRGSAETVREFTARGLHKIEQTAQAAGGEAQWHECASEQASRFSQLQDCYRQVSHIFAYRFLLPDEHLLTREHASMMTPEQEEGAFSDMDVSKVDPQIIRSFLQSGRSEEVREFCQSFTDSLQEAIRSRMFRDYLLLSVRFTAQSTLQEMGITPGQNTLPGEGMHEAVTDPEATCAYIRQIITAAVEERDRAEGARGNSVMKAAVTYLDEHYADESLTLTSAASACNVSPSYFSALFSQQMEQTFIEYVTGKRMERAKELLRKEKLSTAQVAARIGYKDPHYFSFVFKKTQGCTPREYRGRS